MREKTKKLKYQLLCLFLGMAVPFLITMILWRFPENKKEILLEEEKYIISEMLQNQVSQPQTEWQKAMAVIYRTRYRNKKEGLYYKNEIINTKMIEKENEKYYQQIKEAVEKTRGEVIYWEGKKICPEYHYISAGSTRDMYEVYGVEEFPYLKKKESQLDREHKKYTSVVYYSKQELEEMCKKKWGIKGKQFQEIKRDSSGYVISMKVDDREIGGEEWKSCFHLPSSAFTLIQDKKIVMIVTKGIGHGFGLSMIGANEMAKLGANYQSILSYYYPGSQVQIE